MNNAFIILFILLNVADIWTTLRALELGKREINPFLAWMFKRFDPLGVMVGTKVLAVWLLWYIDVYFITTAACALYVWIVLNNWDVIQGKK